jgi:hypothetical protein
MAVVAVVAFVMAQFKAGPHGALKPKSGLLQFISGVLNVQPRAQMYYVAMREGWAVLGRQWRGLACDWRSRAEAVSGRGLGRAMPRGLS